MFYLSIPDGLQERLQSKVK